MNEARKELEASAALGETSLWIQALAEEAESEEELTHLAQVLSTEVGAFLADSSQPVPLSARRALEALERLRKNFYHLWKVLDELYLSEHADASKLERWRQAPQGSQEWRKARQHDEALEVLITAVSD
jgi:hypothetical protein